MASIDLPLGVDAAEYDRVFELGQHIFNPNVGTPEEVSAWFVFVNALNGLAYRLVAAQDYSDKFGTAMSVVPEPNRYTQDHSLFGFSASALSAIECLYMACYGAGAMLERSCFPVDQPKFLVRTPEKVTECFSKLNPLLAISIEMSQIAQSVSYKDLCDLRNALSHRGTLGRKAQLSNVKQMPSLIPSNPKALPAKFTYETELVPNLTSDQMCWVIHSVNKLIKGLNIFLSSGGKS